MSHIPYLKTENARDLNKRSSSVHVLVLVTYMKDQNLLLTNFSKVFKLIHESQPNFQTQENLNSHHTKVPKIQDTYIKHMMYQTIQKPRHTKFIYDPDIPKDKHTYLRPSFHVGIFIPILYMLKYINRHPIDHNIFNLSNW